jgi:hypothetical protein
VWFGGSIGNERKKKISWDQVVGEMEGGGLIVPRRKICYTTTKHSPFMKLYSPDNFDLNCNSRGEILTFLP